MSWRQLSAADAIESVHSAPHGLSSDEAARRLLEFGPNRMEPVAAVPVLLRLFKEFFHFFAVILWVATALAFVGEWNQPGTPGVDRLISSSSNASQTSIPVFSRSSFAIKCSGVSATPLGIIVVHETGIPHPANKIKNKNNIPASLIMWLANKFKSLLTTTSLAPFSMEAIEQWTCHTFSFIAARMLYNNRRQS